MTQFNQIEGLYPSYSVYFFQLLYLTSVRPPLPLDLEALVNGCLTSVRLPLLLELEAFVNVTIIEI